MANEMPVIKRQCLTNVLKILCVLLGLTWSINAQDITIQATHTAKTGLRAIEMLRKRELKQGEELLRQVIPVDTFVDERRVTSRNEHLPQDARRHGENQLLRMREDRPEMKQVGKPDDTLWRWVVAGFAGSTCGALVEWDPTPPQGTALCQYVPPAGGAPGRIMMRKSTEHDPLTPERIWAGLVFEMYNIAFYSDVLSLQLRAYNGNISERDYVKGVFINEYRAIARTRSFFVHVYLPYVIENGLWTDPDVWYMREEFWRWKNADEAFAEATDTSRYPWVPYRRHYWLLRFRGFLNEQGIGTRTP